MEKTIRWRRARSRNDQKAAEAYLSLVYPDTALTRLTAEFARGPAFSAKAKDLLRASDLPLLPRSDTHVQADIKRIHKGKALSPVLLVRGDMNRGLPLVIADGYHRICAICHVDDDQPIACHIAAAKP